jgi:hypothetical protein
MSVWSKDDLRRIAEADELEVAPVREDGVTYRKPTTIWSVALDSALYVRAYKGRQSLWYQAALRQRAGQITAAGVTNDVSFEPVDGPIIERIDDAYRAKYGRSPYVSGIVGASARSATLRVAFRCVDAASARGLAYDVSVVRADLCPSAAATKVGVTPNSIARVACNPRIAWAHTTGTPAIRQIRCTHLRTQAAL